jgi:hypothetical protein
MYHQRARVSSSPRTPRRLFVLTSSMLTAALVAGGLASPAARAADAVAFHGYSLSSGPAPHTSLLVVPFQGGTDATVAVPTLGQSVNLTRPHDASTGLFIGGPVSAAVKNGQAEMTAGAIINEGGSTSGTLTLDLVATATPPPADTNFTGAVMATITLGTLKAQTEVSNFDSGTLPYTAPAAGCYYVSLVLLDNGEVADVRTLPAGGVPENTGYSAFGLGQACPAVTTCTRNNNTVCLDSARFQVTVAYDNTVTGAGAGQVLLFGSTRAESTESGFFYFTDPSNFEMGAKVLNACGVNNAWWVFIGGLTNQGWSLNVLDTTTQAAKFYGNTDGVTTVTTTDTAAFPCP